MKSSAFTLSEVLLTLAIIGVIAALTIPAVIIKVQKDRYVAALKKAYNTLVSVTQWAQEKYGPKEEWNWGNTMVPYNYTIEFFDPIKVCAKSVEDGCFGASYKLIKGADMQMSILKNTNSITTADGTSYALCQVQLNGVRVGMFYVDVNGPKPPNIQGRDLFVFYIYNSKDIPGVKPEGVWDERNQLIPAATMEYMCGRDGAYCAAKVLAEGAMNY